MYLFIQWNFYNVETLGLFDCGVLMQKWTGKNNGPYINYRVAALIFSKSFVTVFYEFSKPLWLLVCCVCFLIVST